MEKPFPQRSHLRLTALQLAERQQLIFKKNVENLYTKLTPEPHLTFILVHGLQVLLYPRNQLPTEVAGCLGFVDRHVT